MDGPISIYVASNFSLSIPKILHCIAASPLLSIIFYNYLHAFQAFAWFAPRLLNNLPNKN
jgi:hypothetical protein